MEDFFYPQDKILEYETIIVPNVDRTRTLYLVDLIAKQHLPVLLIGEQGTAKTVTIKSYISQYNQEEKLSKSISFSCTTTPSTFQVIFYFKRYDRLNFKQSFTSESLIHTPKIIHNRTLRIVY